MDKVTLKHRSTFPVPHPCEAPITWAKLPAPICCVPCLSLNSPVYVPDLTSHSPTAMIPNPALWKPSSHFFHKIVRFHPRVGWGRQRGTSFPEWDLTSTGWNQQNKITQAKSKDIQLKNHQNYTMAQATKGTAGFLLMHLIDRQSLTKIDR